MTVRPINEYEIPVIAEIERLSFSNPWSESSLRQSYESAANRFFAAECDKKIVGYIGITIAADEGYILNVAVSPEYRGQGIGKALVGYVEEKYRDELLFITLEVRPSNLAAVKLYESFGFEKAGERKDYYQNPVENALLLTKFFK